MSSYYVLSLEGRGQVAEKRSPCYYYYVRHLLIFRDRQIRVSQTPFQYLCALEQAVSSCTKEAPHPVMPKKDWVGLSFLSGQHFLLTPLHEIAGILPVSFLMPIPGVKPWLRGMATYRKEIFPVTDLSGFVTQKLTKITNHARILMLQSQGGYAGLLIDRVLTLQRTDYENKKDEILLGVMPLFEPYMQGSVVLPGSQLPIISCQLIIQHPHFIDVAR